METACPTDTALAEFVEGMSGPVEADSIEHHAAACAGCRELLASLRRVAPADGEQVGRYRVLHVLGEGAAGTVYAAHDPRLDRRVALKVVSPEAFGDSARRVLREARAAAQLAHPNVVAVHDVGELEGGGAYLAMELVDGPALSAWRRSAWRSWRDIARVFAAAGRGLAAAHAAGVIHRDFKPDNILCARDGRVLVGDFGLARTRAALADDQAGPRTEAEHAAARESIDQSLFRTGTLLGTPAYMAPEQLTGVGADARSDQFAFAVAFYESLYGERPFAGERLIELFDSVLGGKLRPAPIGSSVPGWLRRLVVRALSTDPEQRFASMDALLAALDRGLARRRWLASAAAAAVVVVGVALSPLVLAGDPEPCSNLGARWTVLWTPARRQAIAVRFAATGNPQATAAWTSVARALDRYGEAWSAMRVQTCRATRVERQQSAELFDLRMLCLDDSVRRAAALIDLLGEADAALVDGATQAAAELDVTACSADATAARRNLMPTGPVAARRVATIRDQIGRAFVLRSAGRLDQAEQVATAAVAEARALAFRPVEAEARFVLGSVLDERSNGKRATEELSAAVWAAEASGHTEYVLLAAARLIALSGTGEGALERGQRWADQATAALERLGNPVSHAIKIHNGLGLLAHRNGKYADAMAQFERALALAGPDAATVDVAHVYNNLTSSYGAVQRFADAQRVSDKAVAIFRSQLHPEHPLALRARNNAGVLMNSSRDFAAALAIFDEVVAARRRNPGTSPVDIADALINRAVALSGLGRPEESLASAQEGLAMLREHAPDSPSIAIVLGNMAKALTELGRLDEAIEHMQMSMEAKRRKLGDDHPSVGLAHLNLGDVMAQAGRYSEALAEAERAQAILEPRVGNQHRYVAYAVAGQGAARAQLGQLAAGQHLLERARHILAATPSEKEPIAQIDFELARVAWRRGDRAKARKLAESALALYESVNSKAGAARVTAWLAQPAP